MDRKTLVGTLVGRGKAAEQVCVKLSSTRFVPRDQWGQLAPHEQQFLRCWAVGASAYTSVLVGRAAATVTGLWVVPSSYDIELANPKSRVPRHSQRAPGVSYRRMTLSEIDIDTLGDQGEVSVTRPVRTVVDIARWHGVKEGIVAMDSLFYNQPPFLEAQIRTELEETVHRLAGKRGIENARHALEGSSTLAESPYESLVRQLLNRNGIFPQEQMRIGPYRVDLLWGTLIIEIDGRAKFKDNPDAALKHIERENRLREMGYWIIRITPKEMNMGETEVLRRIVNAKKKSETTGPVSVPALPPW